MWWSEAVEPCKCVYFLYHTITHNHLHQPSDRDLCRREESTLQCRNTPRVSFVVHCVQFTDNVCLWYLPSVIMIHHREKHIVSLEGYETLLCPNKRSLFPCFSCRSFSSFSSEVSFNLSKASGGRTREREREREHACLWKSTGSAPRCSCHGNSMEYSSFFFFSRPSSEGWQRNRKTNWTRREDERPKRWGGQKDRGIKDKRKR